MIDSCIDKFLVNCKPGNVEKHSDSSDFDETQDLPCLLPKSGNHCIIEKKLRTVSKHKKKDIAMREMLMINKMKNISPNFTMSNDIIPVRDRNVHMTNQNHKNHHKQKIKNRGDEVPDYHCNVGNTQQVQQKAKPCFSSIFRRSNNYVKQICSINEIPDNNLNSGKTFCADCERRRVKKLNRRRQSYVVQPVYAVDNMQTGPVPFGHTNDQEPLPQHNHKIARKQNSNTSYELTSSESDIGKMDQRKQLSKRLNFIDRFQKEMRREYLKYEKELLRNHLQQYPSKKDYKLPYQVFSTPYCQANNAPCSQDQATEALEPGTHMLSTSSGFWDYLFEKIRGKHLAEKNETMKSCECEQQPQERLSRSPQLPQLQSHTPCSPENCAHLEPQLGENIKGKELIPECKSCIQQTDDKVSVSSVKTHYPKKINNQNVKCKCFPKKKHKQLNDTSNQLQKSMTQSDDVIRPCQEPHDDITRTVEEKYNGEILCIHNPPCILINGCLNLPAPTEKTATQGHFWPVTQDKKSSFYHICRKMKRPKHNCEQACQYHPPSIAIQQVQLKTEKIVQSICNHDPPCEVVHGCYKAKYDPKLDNSCVHVPMCQRLPECLMEGKREKVRSKYCEHKPKCTEVPLCSRKFVMLTAKENIATQVRPKTKMVCRHEPPCIMIPKCLARIISDTVIPYEAIPDCVHQPCCDLIPACCRRRAKEMLTLTSVEEGISLKLPRAPAFRKNKLLRVIRRTT